MVKAQYQAASQGGAANPGYIGTGNGLKASGIYGAPYVSPYSIQINGGVQREIAKGTIVSVDFVHNATLKVPLLIDVNHVGAARTLNTTSAKAAIAATTRQFNCAGGSSAAAINCAIAAGATVVNFAGNGLDSGNQYTGGYNYAFYGEPMPAALPGVNPNVGQGEFILPVGRSGYDALQAVLRQQLLHPAPGIVSSNLQVSYSLSRAVNTISGTNAADQFFNLLPFDFDNPNGSMGRSNLDHSNELSFGGSVSIKYGLNIGLIGHFYSAAATSLTLDNTSGDPGEIFCTDVTGDGSTGDLVPGTNPGYYIHQIKNGGLNQLIQNYNATHAGQPTPAGTALITAGLLNTQQLVAMNAVQQPIALAPQHPINTAAFRTLDMNVSYPIRLTRFREGLSLEPAVAMYNAANLSNFGRLGGTLANVTTAGGQYGTVNNFLNGPNSQAVADGFRVQRGSGTFAQGSPRTTEFQLKLNF